MVFTLQTQRKHFWDTSILVPRGYTSPKCFDGQFWNLACEKPEMKYWIWAINTSVDFHSNVKRETLFCWSFFAPVHDWMENYPWEKYGVYKKSSVPNSAHIQRRGFFTQSIQRALWAWVIAQLAHIQRRFVGETAYCWTSVVIPMCYRRFAIGTTNGKSSPKVVLGRVMLKHHFWLAIQDITCMDLSRIQVQVLVPRSTRLKLAHNLPKSFGDFQWI